jgi:hypothetical protein
VCVCVCVCARIGAHHDAVGVAEVQRLENLKDVVAEIRVGEGGVPEGRRIFRVGAMQTRPQT